MYWLYTKEPITPLFRSNCSAVSVYTTINYITIPCKMWLGLILCNALTFDEFHSYSNSTDCSELIYDCFHWQKTRNSPVYYYLRPPLFRSVCSTGQIHTAIVNRPTWKWALKSPNVPIFRFQKMGLQVSECFYHVWKSKFDEFENVKFLDRFEPLYIEHGPKNWNAMQKSSSEVKDPTRCSGVPIFYFGGDTQFVSFDNFHFLQCTFRNL